MRTLIIISTLLIASGCQTLTDTRSDIRDKTLCRLSPEAQALILAQRVKSGVTYDMEVYCGEEN